MIPLPIPSITFEEVYDACTGSISDATLAGNHQSSKSALSIYADDYHASMSAASIHRFSQTPRLPISVTDVDMKNLYANKLRKKSSPGRIYYDRLRVSLPDHLCPFCGARLVASLDHYLPKTEYPYLAVTPTNLIPACGECNNAKGSHVPTCVEDAFPHPYYESFDFIWLQAHLIEATPAGIMFICDTAQAPDAQVSQRVTHYFEKLNLASLYEIVAGRRLTEYSRILKPLDDCVGDSGISPQGVKDFLQALEPAFSDQPNHWNAALIRSLIASDWYCDGGFRSR